jgi:hypothetical protein
MDKKVILQQALEGREAEVLEYQINIDNYKQAIVKIDSDYSDHADLIPFRAQLVELLNAATLEQTKAVIMRDVIATQVEAL